MTLFVIVAIVLIAGILLFFIFRGKIIPDTGISTKENPKSFISACVKDNVNEAVDILLPQGGFIEPKRTKLYNNINVAYLCYNAQYYDICVSEHPVLLREIEKEIKGYIEPKIEQCFQDYKSEKEKENIKVDLGSMQLNVELKQDNVHVKINNEVVIADKEENYKINDFSTEVINPIYNLGRVAAEIASQEAETCDFDNAKYMLDYPRFKITRTPMSDFTKIYTIEDKKSQKEMNIAIRGCVTPPGI